MYTYIHVYIHIPNTCIHTLYTIRCYGYMNAVAINSMWFSNPFHRIRFVVNS